MQPASLRQVPLFIAIVVAGCQATPPPTVDIVVPIYASKLEAQAVSSGQFGAVPIAMPGEAELELVGPMRCSSNVAEVRTRTGRQGWTPVDSLPSRLHSSSNCVGEPPLAAQLER